MSEGDVAMAQASIYDQILRPASRANPFPLYAELRETPVARRGARTATTVYQPRPARP